MLRRVQAGVGVARCRSMMLGARLGVGVCGSTRWALCGSLNAVGWVRFGWVRRWNTGKCGWVGWVDDLSKCPFVSFRPFYPFVDVLWIYRFLCSRMSKSEIEAERGVYSVCMYVQPPTLVYCTRTGNESLGTIMNVEIVEIVVINASEHETQKRSHSQHPAASGRAQSQFMAAPFVTPCGVGVAWPMVYGVRQPRPAPSQNDPAVLLSCPDHLFVCSPLNCISRSPRFQSHGASSAHPRPSLISERGSCSLVDLSRHVSINSGSQRRVRDGWIKQGPHQEPPVYCPAAMPTTLAPFTPRNADHGREMLLLRGSVASGSCRVTSDALSTASFAWRVVPLLFVFGAVSHTFVKAPTTRRALGSR